MTVPLSGHLPPQLSRLARGAPEDPVRPGVRRAGVPTRRVRHLVCDGLAVVLFSAAASTSVAFVLVFLARVVG